MNKHEKEKLANNIELLLRKSFYEGVDDTDIKQECILDKDGEVDIWKNSKNPIYKFALEYPLRSKCYYGIWHLMQYIKMEIDKL